MEAVKNVKFPSMKAQRRMSRSMSSLQQLIDLSEKNLSLHSDHGKEERARSHYEKEDEHETSFSTGDKSARSPTPPLSDRSGTFRGNILSRNKRNTTTDSEENIMNDMRSMMRDLDDLVAINVNKEKRSSPLAPPVKITLEKNETEKINSKMLLATYPPIILNPVNDEKKKIGNEHLPSLAGRPISPPDEKKVPLGGITKVKILKCEDKSLKDENEKKGSLSDITFGKRNAIDSGLDSMKGSRKRFIYDSKSIAGQKDGKEKINQDSILTRDPWRIPGLESGTEFQLFSLMDGHGDCGEKVSNFIKVNLPLNIAEDSHILKDSNLSKALLIGIEKTNKELLLDKTIDSTTSGSTLVCCIIYGSKICVANVGDSRCILGRKRSVTMTSGLRVIPLTTDQHPDRPDEMQRISSSKHGVVERMVGDDGSFCGPLRVWNKDGTGGGLAMSRSLGDSDAHKLGVIAVPEIVERTIDELDQFLIFASDGVWDYISNDEAVDIVEKERSKGLSPKECSRILSEEARRRWGVSDHIDDISSLIVFLH